MAKDKDKKGKGDKAPASKQLKKAKVQWEELERDIDKEFVLLEKQGYPKEELDTLRWDYRYTKLPDFKLTQEQMEYFVAVQESIAAGVDPPPPPGDIDAKASAAAVAAPAPPVNEEYKRKSQVDMDLVEKYLEHRVGRETRSEMSSLYKEAFGEDLHVPDKLDLTDISYAQDMTAKPKAGKLSKSEILGTPEEAKPVEEAKKEEAPAVAAAPAVKVKRPSMAVGLALAFKRGVPDFPTYDEKWWILHPFRFWVIPKRLAGKSVGKFYGIFAANLAILIVQFFPLFGIPILLRLVLWAIRYVYLRFVKSRLSPAMAKMKEKAAIPPAGAAAPAAAAAPPAAAPAPSAEPKKEPTPANAG